jgi:ArsR family transcriptional regulator
MMNAMNGRRAKLSPEQMQAIARALAEPRRFAMLQQIARGASLHCRGLQEREEISPATISHHLKELQEAGLIGMEREGRCMNLSLRREIWQAYLDQLADI